jgi:DNA-binding transcriptional regulator YiaG
MREFDEACLEAATDIKLAEIRALREREHISGSRSSPVI